MHSVRASHGFRRARARHRIEVAVTEYLLGCDRVEFYRTQIQGRADGRVAEYDKSAKLRLPRRWLRVKQLFSSYSYPVKRYSVKRYS
jgi:hypothetical protein